MSKSVKKRSSKEKPKIKSQPLTQWLTPEKSTNSSTNTQTRKTIYRRETYNLGDGAKVILIPGYVRKPADLFKELEDNIPWKRFKYDVNEYYIPR